MDGFDIYVNVETPSGNGGKIINSMKCSENTLEYEDKFPGLVRGGTEPRLSGAGDGKLVKTRCCRAAAVLSGLLGLLLLTGFITLAFICYNSSSEKKMIMSLLETSYNNRTREREQFQNNYTRVAAERDGLQTALKTFLNGNGWLNFGGSFYYTSSTKDTWKQSRDYCLQRGSDLMVINSQEEQAFANQFQRSMWIGLTDSRTEGKWQWVDGSPMTKGYWNKDEPNGAQTENCVDTKDYTKKNSWNDEACSSSQFWICEKKL